MAKLAKIVLHFDDGEAYDVPKGYTAVYVNAARAKKANEKEPWDKEPRSRGKGPGGSQTRDMGKDDSSEDLNPRCYIYNEVIICP